MKSVAAALFLLVLAAGCGDDSDGGSAKEEPERKTASSTEDFCAAITEFAQAAGGDDWAAVQKAADSLEASGLPEDAPEAAGKGYDAVLELVGKYDSNEEIEKNITEDQDNEVEELLNYTRDTCQPESPSATPTE